jgi:hypothetical protein
MNGLARSGLAAEKGKDDNAAVPEKESQNRAGGVFRREGVTLQKVYYSVLLSGYGPAPGKGAGPLLLAYGK